MPPSLPEARRVVPACLFAASLLAGCVVTAPENPTCGPDGKDCPDFTKLSGQVGTAQLPTAGDGIVYADGKVAIDPAVQYSDAKVSAVLAASAGPGLAFTASKLGLATTGCGTGGVLVWTGTEWSCTAQVGAAQVPLASAVFTDPTIQLTSGSRTITAAELGTLDGVTGPVQAQLDARQPLVQGAASSVTDDNLDANTALISSGNGKIAAHASVSATELGFLDGVTGNVQEQFAALDTDLTALESTVATQAGTLATLGTTKQNTITGAASTLLTADLTANRVLLSSATGKVAVSNITPTELSYLGNVTSPLQAQLDGRQPLITGAASTITTANLTPGRILASDASGKVTVLGSPSTTELGYVSGATSNVQAQLDAARDELTQLKRRRMTVFASGGPSFLSEGFPSPVVETTNWPLATTFTADGNYVTVSQSSGGTSSLRSGYDAVRRELAPELTVNLRSEGNAFGIPKANWVGLTSGGGFGMTAMPSGVEFMGFRWVSTLDSGRWACVTSDGTATTAVDSGVAVGNDVPFELRVAALADGTAVRFFINGVLRCTIATTLPKVGVPSGANYTPGTLLGFWVSTTHGSSGGWTNIDISRVILTHE